jgi:hypothetical protein
LKIATDGAEKFHAGIEPGRLNCGKNLLSAALPLCSYTAGMITHICDRCGRPLEQGQLRYLAKIEVVAAADPLEITFDDLLRDTRREIDALLDECEQLTEEQLMRDVYVKFEFDLCRACQKAYVTDPLSIETNL